MKNSMVLCALALVAGVARASVIQATPIDKVVLLLEDLSKKIEADGTTEQKQYDNYACWVESTLGRKASDISSAKDLIGQLGDSILKTKAEIASHQAEIAQLKKDIAQNDESVKEAKGVRDKEYNEYANEKTESEQCLGALEQAIKVLTGAGAKKAFLQQAQLMSIAVGVREVMQRPRSRAKVSDTDFQVVRHFLDKPEEFAPRAQGLIAAQIGQNPFGDYAPQSTQIQGILKGMYDAFMADLEKDNAEEAEHQKSFEQLFGTKIQELKTLEATLEIQETDAARKTKKLAEEEVLLDDTTATLAADEKFFEDTKDAAESKAKAWSIRTRMRVEELAGIQGAIGILKGGSKTFETATSTFVQLKAVRQHSSNQEEAYNKLRVLAAKYQSKDLQLLVASMKNGGHFDKVIVMIDHMIALLRKEEQEDIEHRDRCENSENANKNSLEDVSNDINKAKKSLERMGTEEDALKKSLDDIADKISETKDTMAKMLKERNDEHAEFQKALKADADAIALIEMAVVRLTKYYKDHGLPLGLMQAPEYAQDPDKAPETSFDTESAHTSESGGIVSILDMIKEDLQKEMTEGRADEARAQADYEKQSGALQDTLDAQKETNVGLEKELAALQESISGMEKHEAEKKADKDSEEEMKKALKSDCNWVKTHFKSRRDNRKKEMDGLLEAKNFLAGVEAGDPVLAP